MRRRTVSILGLLVLAGGFAVFLTWRYSTARSTSDVDGGDGQTSAKQVWRRVALHHSATASGSMAVFDRFHREKRGWDEIGYHFVIGNGTKSKDGEVEVTPRWEKQRMGAHTLGHNRGTIGICLVGNFDETVPTEKQQAELVRLLAELLIEYDIPLDAVRGHRDFANAETSCPGRNFPFDKIIRRTRKLIDGLRGASPAEGD